MATVDETIASIIAGATATAAAYTDKATAATRDASTAARGYTLPQSSLVPFEVTAIEPEVPYVADATLTYEANRIALIELMSTKLAEYYNTYYPLAADAFDEATNWLVNAITVGGTGIKAGIEDQIWQRGRTRIITEGKRVEAKMVNAWAARGFTLPPGALVGGLKEMRFEQLAKNSELSSTVAIKQAELEIENIKFAVDLAIKSRLAAMDSATNYIRALMLAPDAASRIALLNSDVRAKMISSTADLYRARLQRDELVLRSSNADQDTKQGDTKIGVEAFYRGIDNEVKASMAAADTYGKAAAAALSSLNTVASSSQLLFS